MGRRRPLAALAGLFIGGLVLSGCQAAETPADFDRTPERIATELEAADTSGLQLPFLVEPLELVEPGWDLPVAHLGDVLLSARDDGESLMYSAVDTHGTALWRAQRPSGCTGFTLSVDDAGAPLAVLTDSASTDDCDEDVTASAYDLMSGERRWGPVEVPGPLRGPGTVFAVPDAAEVVVLDPATGDPVAAESGSRHLGEYRGTILSVTDEALVATGGGAEDWTIPLADTGGDAADLRGRPSMAAGSDVIALDTGDGTGPVVDRLTGEVLAKDARAVAVDENAEAVVTLGDQGLRVNDGSGAHELPISVAESVHLAAAAGGLIYLRSGGTMRVHNATTGSVASAYPADGSGIVAVPDAITINGLGTLLAGDRTLLATDRVVEDPEESTEESAEESTREAP